MKTFKVNIPSLLFLAGVLWISFPPRAHSLKAPDLARRRILSWTTSTVVPIILCNPIVAFASEERSDITLRIERGQRAGIELCDTFLEGRQAVTVKSVSADAAIKHVVPGMVVVDYQDAKSVVKRIHEGPFPVDLKLINPNGQDSEDKAFVRSPSGNAPLSTEVNGLVIRTVRQVNAGEKVRRGDLVEFVYEARMISQTGPIYDSSAQRGTGQPYQYVVGSGDLIPGVDLGLYDMRPGEVRVLQSTYDNFIETDITVYETHIIAIHLLVLLPVPSLLAYGSRGSKLFQIPPSTTLFWTVQMIRVNFIGEAT